MEKIENQHHHLLLLLSLSFCITAEPNGEPHLLSSDWQQSNIPRASVYTHQVLTEKSKNPVKPSIKDHLKKLKNPKNAFKFCTFIAGTTTALAVNAAIHTLGHNAVWKFFYPKNKNYPEIELHENNNHYKLATEVVAGPVTAFLASYGPFKLLTQYNTTKSTPSPFLSGLEFGLQGASYTNVATLVSIPSDGYRAIQFLRKQHTLRNQKWHRHVPNLLAILVILKLLEPDFVKHCSHLFL